MASDSTALCYPKGLHFFERGWLSSNNVLLVDASQTVLIDSGYWTHADQTVALVASALAGRPLNVLLNSHLHSDHCGGNAALQAVYPELITRIPPGQAHHVFDWDPAALSYTPTGQHCPAFSASGLIQPGDQFTVGDMQWRAYAAPGHDPDALIFHSASHGLLISADALWERGFGVVFPELEGQNGFASVSDTLDLIESLSPTLVLPGHGAAFQDVRTALSVARERLRFFQSSPHKHARYAAKVLIKFKLMEFNAIALERFDQWAHACALLVLLHATYAKHQTYQSWLDELIHDLSASQSLQVRADLLVNL